ncbi:hypothetical protein JCM3765_003750 [Sporobolomyces pararoseus]
MARPKRYMDIRTGPRHMSCEPCRKRKSKCSRTVPCSGCLERGHSCVWTAPPLEEMVLRSGVAAVYENKQEIMRLKKVVKQLETIVAEREYQISKCLTSKKKVNCPLSPTIEEYLEAEEYFKRTNAEEEGVSDPLPPPSHEPVENDPFQPQLPPSHSQQSLSSDQSWKEHARAETWPQRATPIPLPPPPQPHSLPPSDLPPTHSQPSTNHSSHLYDPRPTVTSIAPPPPLPLPDAFDSLSSLLDRPLDAFTFSPQPLSHPTIDYNVPSYDPKAPQINLSMGGNWLNYQTRQNSSSQAV